MAPATSPFIGNLLGNLRLSAMIIVVAVAGVVIYALAAGEEVAWNIVVFLAIGMFLSSLLNAWIDARNSARADSRR